MYLLINIFSPFVSWKRSLSREPVLRGHVCIYLHWLHDALPISCTVRKKIWFHLENSVIVCLGLGKLGCCLSWICGTHVFTTQVCPRSSVAPLKEIVFNKQRGRSYLKVNKYKYIINKIPNYCVIICSACDANATARNRLPWERLFPTNKGEEAIYK